MLSETEQHQTLPPATLPPQPQLPPQIQELIHPPLQQPTFVTLKDQNDLILASAKKLSWFRVLGGLLKKFECFRKCLRRQRDEESSFYAKHKKEIVGVLSIAMTLFVFFNYQTFKEYCTFESQSECLQKFILPKIKVWLPKIVVDCIFGLLQVHFLFAGTTYRVIPLVGVVEILFLYVLSDQTISPTYYIGAINFVHLSLLAILLMFYLFLAGLVFCAYKNKYVFYVFLGLIALTTILFYVFIIKNSCQNWEKGINGKIERIEGLCKIKTPSYCWNQILDGYFRLDWIFKDCSLSQAAKKNYNRFFEIPRSTGPFIAYANPNTFTELQRTDQFLQNSTFKHAVGFQTLNQAKSSSYKPDIVFDSDNQTYYIEVQKNESLIKERAAAWQKTQDSAPPLAKNVIFLYVDAISRESAHMLLPKIVSWFQKQASFKSYEQKESHRRNSQVKNQAFQFYRYSSLKPWTQPNEFTMMYGVNIEDPVDMQLHSQKIVSSMTKSYMQKGYITGSANSFCQAISANLEQGALYAFETTRYDHESQSFACDPNFQDPSNVYSFVQGPYSSGKRCLYGKTIVDYVSEYAYSFFQTYKDEPKFFSMHFLQGHEGTGEGPKNLDSPLYNLLEKLEKDGFLQDTMVMLVSDHGLHMQGVLYALGVESFLTEKNLPLLMVRVPQRMNKKYRDKIRMNQQYMVTSKNVHHFLKHIAEGENYEGKNMSLLSDLTANDSCPKVGISNSTHCSCKQ